MKKIIAVAAAALVLSACGPSQFTDAPVGNLDDVPQFVMTNVDGFPNISFRCFGTNGIYTTTRDLNALTIIVDDPVCANQENLDFVADRFTPQEIDPSEFNETETDK